MTTITESTTPVPKKRSLLAILTRRETRPYINPYLGGALLGMVLFLAFFITGNGLGASGGLNRILVYFEDLIAPSHIDQVPYLITLAGGAMNALDSWLVFMTVGTILGGFFSGWYNGRLKVETNRGPRLSRRARWVFAFLGGAFMGYGARMARGCTSGQALSGGAVLSVGSWAFMFAVLLAHMLWLTLYAAYGINLGERT